MSAPRRLPARGRCALPDRAVAAGTLPAGTRFDGVAGHAWLTVAGDPVDHLLQPGGSHVLRRSGRVVVEALGAVEFVVRSVAHASRRSDSDWSRRTSSCVRPS
jgi:hypothetical protein